MTTNKINHEMCILTTSFALLRAAKACTGRYDHLAAALGGIAEYGEETPIPITLVLKAIGLEDTIWALQAVNPGQRAAADKLARLLAADCAEHILVLYEREYPNDWRPRQAIQAARQFALGAITAEQLSAAHVAAQDAANGIPKDAPVSNAYVAAWAVWSATAASCWKAVRAAWYALSDACLSAAASGTHAEERQFQQERLIHYLTEAAG